MNDELIPLLVAVHGGRDWRHPHALQADFSVNYTDQSERDHEILVKAVRAGKLEVFVQRE